jgi:hypothetical protein
MGTGMVRKKVHKAVLRLIGFFREKWDNKSRLLICVPFLITQNLNCDQVQW